jgi:hypothetical protein
MTTLETVLLILLVAVPFSIYRQMQVNEVDAGGLVRLPLIFVAIGIFGFGVHSSAIEAGAEGDLYLLASVAVAIGFGVWRGRKIDIWRNDSGDGWRMQGNKTTLWLWAAMILVKVLMGTIASVTDIYSAEQTGEIFVFIGVSFAVQNVIVAQRTLWRDASPLDSMQSQKPPGARTQ